MLLTEDAARPARRRHIEDTSGQIRRDALGSYRVPFYEMTIPTHMAWCSALSATDEEMAAIEGL